MSMNYYPMTEFGVVLETDAEIGFFAEKISGDKSVLEEYSSASEYLAEDGEYLQVESAGNGGLFFAEIFTVNIINNHQLSPGTFILDVPEASFLTLLPESENDKNFEPIYTSKEDIVSFAKNKYGNYLPANFPWEERTGEILGVFFG